MDDLALDGSFSFLRELFEDLDEQVNSGVCSQAINGDVSDPSLNLEKQIEMQLWFCHV